MTCLVLETAHVAVSMFIGTVICLCCGLLVLDRQTYSYRADRSSITVTSVVIDTSVCLCCDLQVLDKDYSCTDLDHLE